MGCGGTGQVPRVRCAACEGAGLVDRERSYTVRIPPGSIGGSTQRVPREGAPGRRGGPSGDLHVDRARAPASVLRPRVDARRGGPDHRAAAHLRRGDAGGGARRAGARRARADAVPPGTQAGATFRLRGKGFPRAGRARRRPRAHRHRDADRALRRGARAAGSASAARWRGPSCRAGVRSAPRSIARRPAASRPRRRPSARRPTEAASDERGAQIARAARRSCKRRTAPPRPKRLLLHVGLFLATFLTTTAAGAMLMHARAGLRAGRRSSPSPTGCRTRCR